MKRNRNYLRIGAMQAMMVMAMAVAVAQNLTINSNRRVAIASLDPTTAYGSSGPGRLGDVAADMLTTELVDMGASVVERAQMKKQLGEEDLSLTGIVDSQTAPEIGKKLGAEWMIVGRITEFGIKDRSGGLHSVPIIGGLVGGSLSEARVKIDARIVDVRTGLILAAASGEGKESQGSIFSVGGNLLGFLHGVDFNSSEWTDSRLGKAARKATHELAINFAKKWANAESKCGSSQPLPSNGGNGEAEPAPKANLGSLKGLSAIVVIPETIFLRPRVPDPAAETEVIRQLLRSGMTVIDDQRARQLSDDRQVLAMLRGGADRAKLEELRQKFGADILIVGEAIAERNAQQPSEVGSIFSRARVEMRAIRMDTGEILAADGEHAPGRDMSEVLAGKNALQTAAKQLAPKFIADMAAHISDNHMQAGAVSTKLEIEISGWSSLGAAQGFLSELRGVSGVQNASRKDFRGGILFATVEVNRSKMSDLAEAIESSPVLRHYHIAIQTASAAKVEGKISK